MQNAKKTNVTGLSNKVKYEGKQFGNLIVIEYINAREVVCQCQCDKHNIIVTRKYKLDNGSVISCGCLSEHEINKVQYEKIKTTEFEVIRYINAANIVCKCSCGRPFTTTKTHIDKKEVHSCGCRQHHINYNKQYTENSKGYLTIGKHIGYGIYECKCKCGNTCYRSKQQLDNTDNPSCGCNTHAYRGRKESSLILLEKIYNYIEGNKGKTVQEIADALELSYSTIQKAIHTLNIENSVVYNDSVSYEEKEVRQLIESFGQNSIYNTRSIINPLELDIYIPDKKIAIEFNGNYWHSDNFMNSNYHRDKTLKCALKGIRLIHIFEYEWTDTTKKEVIKQIIKNAITDNKRIYARNTVIKEVSVNDYRDFCNNNHLQGYANASVLLGCFYNDKLIGIMSFGKPRFDTNNEYELIRLCWYKDFSVIGGTEKLFKYFLDKYKPKSIVTYCNISKFTGNIYKRLGFKPIEITEPNYVWTKNKFNKTLTRYQTQKHKLVTQGLGTENQTEDEIMTNLGYIKVYDCGNLRFEWKA